MIYKFESEVGKIFYCTCFDLFENRYGIFGKLYQIVDFYNLV